MRNVFYVLSALVLLSLFVFDLRTAAQDTSVREELALAVAKVAVNEAGWGSPADVALIWQVTEARGDTHEERLTWLTVHSSCVLSDRPRDELEAERNCRWTRNLTDSDVEPEGWPRDVIWRNYTRRWRQIRRFAQQLVDGRASLRPCTETPQTWGGRGDEHGAHRRGLRPVECAGTLNTGYVVAEVDRI